MNPSAPTAAATAAPRTASSGRPGSCATRRHARDYKRLGQHSEALITWAAITF
ncbi:hypothetical protein ACFQZC_01260 [Streptacidiphilus monticola]